MTVEQLAPGGWITSSRSPQTIGLGRIVIPSFVSPHSHYIARRA